MSSPIRATSAGGSVDSRRRRVVRSSPSIRSMTRYGPAGSVPGVQARDDVRVVQDRGGRGLAPEALHEVAIRRDLGAEDLDGDAAAGPLVVGAIDGGHAAATDDRLESIATAEQAPEVGVHGAGDPPRSARSQPDHSPGARKRRSAALRAGTLRRNVVPQHCEVPTPMTIEKNLITDETVKLEVEKHWIAPIQASFVAILMILGAAAPALAVAELATGSSASSGTSST